MGGEIGRPRMERRKRDELLLFAEEPREWAAVKKERGLGLESLWEEREVFWDPRGEVGGSGIVGPIGLMGLRGIVGPMGLMGFIGLRGAAPRRWENSGYSRGERGERGERGDLGDLGVGGTASLLES